jgi:DNA-binding NarL/FixJ family response regulator
MNATNPPAPDPIRVLIVDDDPLVRAGLRLMLGGAADIAVVGEASDGDEVPDAFALCSPHVVLMDIRMSRLDGIEATRQLRTGQRDVVPAVIMLTTFRADTLVLDALRAGAAGFLLKHTAPHDIVAAVRTAAAGEPIVSPSVLRQLIAHVSEEHASDGGSPDPRADPRADPHADPHADQRADIRDRGHHTPDAAATLAALSARERDIAFAVAEGLNNAEIADRLYVSVGTVKAHLSATLAKLGLENRIQLAILAHDARRER